ncbi:NifU family domain-containing protein [Cardiosporidium cionae]|uniref:NifU family domain-containing protein n=1 Tax=Cardiosporidium cionae TaxID=476202 RepID=A0ABQ7J8W4_9APIC|nr:NifU family domain-containing protein [Cardiosporidium cionae]|eukprot:KAF8820422.1 NifU family domain-containing protein [Cardiosporidium cionae]
MVGNLLENYHHKTKRWLRMICLAALYFFFIGNLSWSGGQGNVNLSYAFSRQRYKSHYSCKDDAGLPTPKQRSMHDSFANPLQPSAFSRKKGRYNYIILSGKACKKCKVGWRNLHPLPAFVFPFLYMGGFSFKYINSSPFQRGKLEFCNRIKNSMLPSLGLHSTARSNFPPGLDASMIQNNEFSIVKIPCYDGINVLRVKDWLGNEESLRRSLPAVFALMNPLHQTLFVGFSADLFKTLRCYVERTPPHTFEYIRLKSFSAFNESAMKLLKTEWICELGEIPVGNREDNPIFSSVFHDQARKVSVVNGSSEDLNAFSLNAKKKSGSKFGEKVAKITSPLNVNGTRNNESDDKINQTPKSDPELHPIDSSVDTNLAITHTMNLTIENVDILLETVRPYLIADGGNVAVVEVDPSMMEVKLLLQGSCVGCPSSTVTLKLGIERFLKETWPQVTVIQVEENKETSPSVLSKEMVEDVLSQFQPVVKMLGGEISVLTVADGVILFKYSGPEKSKICEGIKAILDERIPEGLLKRMEIVD